MKMQFMQQIVQGNPKYQEALQGDERFQALLENYGKNLQQSVAQEQNKMIGRIGSRLTSNERGTTKETPSAIGRRQRDLAGVEGGVGRGNRDECGQCDQ